MNGMGTGEWYEPSGLTPEELAALLPYDEIAGKEFTKIAAIYGEEVAINVIIATDPDCWVPTEEEFARARPAIEVDPDLVKAAWSANRRGIGVSQSQRRRSQGSGTHRNRSRLRN